MHFFWKRVLFFLFAMALIAGFCCVSVVYLSDAQETAAMTDQKCTLILDAGHGGEDGGAVSANGMIEAEVNLQITQRLRALAELAGVPVVMTRTSADIAYPDSATTTAQRKVADQKQRVEQINAVSNAILISIHQNCFPHTSPHGSQVLYAATEGSDALGALMHENLNAYLNPENRRVAAPISEKIYLMRNVHCPAVLVECGFLSNPDEAARLADPGYQTKLAAVILASYLQYRQTLPQTGRIT